MSYEEREILVLENPLLPSSQIDVIIVSVGIKSRISIWIIRQLQDHFVSVSGFMDQKKRYPLLMLNPILNPFCLFKNILRNLGHVLKVSSKFFIGENVFTKKVTLEF